MNRLFCGIAALALIAPGVVSAAETTISSELRAKLGAGWTFYESGNLRKAIEVLEEALATEEGAKNPELHYLLGAVWWDRRNAAAALRLWTDAETKAETLYDWNSADPYSAKIAQRLVYVRRNFGVVRMSLSGRRVLVPQADPPPKDPILREFITAAATLVTEVAREGSRTVWVALPKGTYWLGLETVALEAGELDMTKAPEWTLPAATGAARRAHEARSVTGGGPLIASASGDDQSRYDERIGHIALGGGGVSVPTQNGAAGISGAWNVEVGVDIPVASGVALDVGASFTDLPVSTCVAEQTRAGVISGHVGPRLSRLLTDRLWLSGSIGFHLGGGFSTPVAGDRERCALARLDSDPGELKYGAVVGEEGEAVAYSDLGWDGGALALGPHGEIGILGAPDQSAVYLGVAFFVRHDQIFAITPGGAAWYRTSTGVESTEIGPIDAAASMPRLQFGVRGRIKF